ncbi:unnamed protein product [Sphagnum balticum]
MADQNQGLDSSQPQPQPPNYGVNDRYGIIGNQIRLDNNNNLMDSSTAQIIVPIAHSKVYPPIPPDTYIVHSVPKMAMSNRNFNINMPFGAVPTQPLARGPPVIFITPKPATPARAIPASDHHAPYSSSPFSAQPQSASGYSTPIQDAPGEPSSNLQERIVERYRNSSKEEKLKALINALRDSAHDPTDLVVQALRDIAHEQHEKANAAEKKIKQLEGKLEFAKVQYSSALDLSESLRKEKKLLLEENEELKADLQLLNDEIVGNGFGGQSTTEESESSTNAGRETRSAKKRKLVSDLEMAGGEESPIKRRR